MNSVQEHQLLRFIREEVLPIVLQNAEPGAVEVLIRRLRREYRTLELFGVDSLPDPRGPD